MSGAHVYRYTFPGLIMVTKNSCHYIFFLLNIFFLILRYVCSALGCGRYELTGRSAVELAGCWLLLLHHPTTTSAQVYIERKEKIGRKRKQLLSRLLGLLLTCVYTPTRTKPPWPQRCSPLPAAIMPQQYCL